MGNTAPLAPNGCEICLNPKCSGAHTVAGVADFVLVTAYLKEGWTHESIATTLGLSRCYVSGIAKGWLTASLCDHCGVAFFPRRSGTRRQRFDRVECQHAYARGEAAAQPLP